jgi:hypothetical protein
LTQLSGQDKMSNTITLPVNGGARLISRSATAIDTANFMCDLIRTLFYDAETRRLAFNFTVMPGDPIDNAARYVYKHTQFTPDTNRQTVRTPLSVLRTGRANCVDYSVFMGTIAKILGYDVTLVICDFDGTGYSHVYPLIDGVPYDLTIGQSEFERNSDPVLKKSVYCAEILKFTV